jgi:hypothetical protein
MQMNQAKGGMPDAGVCRQSKGRLRLNVWIYRLGCEVQESASRSNEKEGIRQDTLDKSAAHVILAILFSGL